MLLVRQAVHKQDSGQFVSPVGGHVAAGEKNDQALLREAEEEIVIKDFRYKHLGNLIFDRVVRGKRENHYFIIYEIHADITLVLNDESDDYRWFSKKEINQNLTDNQGLLGEACILIWEKYLHPREVRRPS